MTEKIIAKKYKVLRELGRGGMGIIYEALHLGLNRKVAIKVLHPQFTNDSAFLKRFQREARAMARLDHENIIRVFDVSEDHGTHYIEMEYFSGEDLKQLMIKESPFSQEKAFLIAYHVAKALSFAHAHGVIHRDIKLANIMLNPTGLVKIADFGIAAATDEVTVTTTGSIIGTPEYMSPEQARGEEELDGRSDLYSLGMVIHKMITGQTAFGGISGMAILGKLVYDPKEYDLFLPDKTLLSVQKLIETLLKKKKDERIPDAATLCDRIAVIIRELQGKQDQPEADLQTALSEVAVKAEEEVPETVILSKAPSVKKESELEIPASTVLLQEESSLAESKKTTQEGKRKKSRLLVFTMTILSILIAGFYYFFSFEGVKIQTQQADSPESSPSLPRPSALMQDIQALKRSISVMEKKLKRSKKRADTPEVAHLAKETFGQGIDMEEQASKTLDDASSLLKQENEQEAKEIFQSALSFLSQADEYFQKAKQSTDIKILQAEKSQTEKERQEQQEAQAELERLRGERVKIKAKRLEQEKRVGLEQEKLKQEKARAETERLNQEKVRADRERLEEERLARVEQEKAKAEKERLIQERAAAEEEKLKQAKADTEKKRLEQKRAQAEQERLRQERLALAEKEKLFREKSEAERKKRDQEKIAEEQKKSSPIPLSPNEMNVLGGIINNLKSAYEKKDLEALQSMSRMSKKRTRFLTQIFNNYKNIKISIVDLSMVGNEAHVAISITELTSQDDNQVVPASRWKDAELILHRKEGKWGKITW